MTVRFNRWADFLERVIWTAIQAAAGAAIVTGFDDWRLTLEVSGTAALISALKVIIAQRVGDSPDGAASPVPPIEVT